MRNGWLGVLLPALTLGCGAGSSSEPVAGSRAPLVGLVEITSPDATEVGTLGVSIDISGSRVLTGDPGYGNSPNIHRGAAWSFTEAASWTLEGPLTQLDTPMSNGKLGAAVALDGGVAVVTEPGGMAVYVFAYVSNAWSQQAKIDVAPLMGYAVDVSADTVALARRRRAWR